MFSFRLSDELLAKLAKLRAKDRKRTDLVYKKIQEIVKCDDVTVRHYKNLRHDLHDLKRVHIDSSFVLLFHVDQRNRLIRFVDFDHHDRVYRR